MAKRSLIMYTSWTGNTEKVANRFKKVFDKYGWECDMFKVDHRTDVKNPPFDLDNYDLLCVGTPVIHKKPIEELMSILAGAPLPPSEGGPKGALMGIKNAEDVPEKYRFSERMLAKRRSSPPKKIVFGPESKKGIIFATYSGADLGPVEAEPAMDLLALEMEHIPIKCIGKFSCPGKHGDMNWGWYKDLSQRPNERDLKKAEIFMEEILEELD